MKKLSRILCLAMTLALTTALAACGPSAPATETTAETTAAPETTTEETTQPMRFDKLALEFVPSREAEVIIAATAGLPQLVQQEMRELGYDIGDITITVGSSYTDTGEALAAGDIDAAWLPGSTYAAYSDAADILLTATRSGLSNDSTTPADWNGDDNATRRDGPQTTRYRALIYATPSAYGKALADKVNAGEVLTWEELDAAKWAVQARTSSAGFLYPSLWLMENYDGRTLNDLSNVITLDGYASAFSHAAAESVDIIVCYADGRNDYEGIWTDAGEQGLGREASIWNELNVIGVTEEIYNDGIVVSKASPFCTDEMKAALQDCFLRIINTEEGKNIFGVYSHTGYVAAKDSDYNSLRAALSTMAG